MIRDALHFVRIFGLIAIVSGCGSDSDGADILGRRCEDRVPSNSCGAERFCAYSEAAQCGELGIAGSCATRPEACTLEYAPVCGCDGVTYSTSCVANGAGVSVRTAGECP